MPGGKAGSLGGTMLDHCTSIVQTMFNNHNHNHNHMLRMGIQKKNLG